jgi:MFS family permease
VISGGLSDRFGRKRLLIASALVFVVSSVGTGLVDTFFAFNLWRMAGGVAIGLASNLSPMYIAEIAPAAVRGRLVAMNQFTIVIGILLAQAVNYGIAGYGERLDDKVVAEHARQHGAALDARGVAAELAWQLPAEDRAAFVAEFARLAKQQSGPLDAAAVAAVVEQLDSQRKQLNPKAKPLLAEQLAVELGGRGLESWNVPQGWRWMFIVTAVPACLFFVLMFLVPESPRWLVKNGQAAQARGVLARIGGPDYAAREVADIEATLAGEIERVNFRDLVEPRVLSVLVLGVTLAVLQQWCGINVIFYYAADLFRDAGLTVSGALLNIVYLGLVNLVATVIAVYSVDRFGRRILMLIGFAGLAVLHTLIGATFFADRQGGLVVGLSLAAVGCYALSLAPVTWVVLAEIFPNRIRGAAMSVAVSSLWIACFLLTYTFPLLNSQLGPAVTFWLYAAVCLAGFVFIWLRLPETKGKTLEEIEKELVE